MPNPDDWMTASKISKAMGGAFSEEYVRAATYRANGYHPLPCVAFGTGRKQRRIKWGTWLNWLDEEAERSVSA